MKAIPLILVATGKSAEVSLEQYSKAPSPILVTAGKSTEVKLEQLLKALEPILVATGKSAEVSLEQFLKASLRTDLASLLLISVTLRSMIVLDTYPVYLNLA